MLRGALGTYTLLGELGRGGMGSVYRARHHPSGREVALKRMHPQLLDLELLARFRREGEALRGSAHPNLVTVLDTQLQGPEPFIVFELVEGQTLRERVEAEGALPWRTAARLIAEAARGLAAAHARNLLHRDIKPENVLLGPLGAKLADFGLVKPLDLDSLTRTQAGIMGTVAYAAPELAAAERERVSVASDTYGLAATLYFALTGREPFRRESTLETLKAVLHEPVPGVRTTQPDVPKWLESLCAKGMSKDPAQRVPTAVEFAEALEAPPETQTRRPSWHVFLALAGLALAGGGLAGWLATRGQESVGPREPVDGAPSAPARPALPALPAVPADTIAEPDEPLAEDTGPAAPVAEGPLEGSPLDQLAPALQRTPPIRSSDAMIDFVRRLRAATKRIEQAPSAEGRATRKAVFRVALGRLLKVYRAQVFSSDARPLIGLLEATVELVARDRGLLTDLAVLLPRFSSLVESLPSEDVARLLSEEFARVPPTDGEILILATLLANQQGVEAGRVSGMLARLSKRDVLEPKIRVQAAMVALRVKDPELTLVLLPLLALKGLPLELRLRALNARAVAGFQGAGTPEDYLEDATILHLSGATDNHHMAWAFVALGQWNEATREVERLEKLPSNPARDRELKRLRVAISTRNAALPDDRLQAGAGAQVPVSVRHCKEAPQPTTHAELEAFLALLDQAAADSAVLRGGLREFADNWLFTSAFLHLRDGLREGILEPLSWEPVLAFCVGRTSGAKDVQFLVGLLLRVGHALIPTESGQRVVTLHAELLESESRTGPRLSTHALLLSRSPGQGLEQVEALLQELAKRRVSQDPPLTRLDAAKLAIEWVHSPELTLALLDANWLRRSGEHEIRGRSYRAGAFSELGEWELLKAEADALEQAGDTPQRTWSLRVLALAGLGLWDEADVLFAVRPEGPPVEESKVDYLREALANRELPR